MTTLNALETRLQQLRLTGMREALVARCEAARATGQDPYELVLALLEDEAARRDSDAVRKRVRAAQFEALCDFRACEWLANPQLPKARLLDLARGQYLTERASILLCGPTGVGNPTPGQCPAAHERAAG
jgi:DNA replication protein DnaC